MSNTRYPWDAYGRPEIIVEVGTHVEHKESLRTSKSLKLIAKRLGCKTAGWVKDAAQ